MTLRYLAAAFANVLASDNSSSFDMFVIPGTKNTENHMHIQNSCKSKQVVKVI